MMVRRRRGGLAAATALAGLLVASGPAAAAGPDAGSGGISDSAEINGFTVSYSLSGVTPGPGDTPPFRSGTVTGDTVTLTGSASFTQPGGGTHLAMSAHLYVSGGASESEAWPPPGVSGDVVGATTVTMPFNLTVKVPPVPDPPPTVDPFDLADPSASPTAPPYATVTFSVSARNCNDSGVCGGPEWAGIFLVFATPSGLSVGVGAVDWVATVGALGAVAAAAAAFGLVPGSTRGADGNGDRSQTGDRRRRYVLQLSADRVEARSDRPGTLEAQVWEVGSDGSVAGANAAITMAASLPELVVSPASGTGSLSSSITVVGPPTAGTGTLTVEASAEGLEMRATAEVAVGADYELVIS